MKVLWVVVAVMAVGCGTSDGKCSLDSDCRGGVCVEGSCAPRFAARGEPCSTTSPLRLCARGLFCFRRSCTPAGQRGDACSTEPTGEFRGCADDLFCVEGRCDSYEALSSSEARALEKARERAIARRLADERHMLEAAGAETPDAEVIDGGSPVRRSPGRAVRVVEIENPGFAIAACRSNERLIGGGCEGPLMIANRPAGYSGADTVGARWSCRSDLDGAPTRAFALCEPIPER